MKKLFIVSALAAACAVGSVGALTREMRQLRVDAVNTLSRSVQCKFINQQTLLDALNFIDQELDPKTHQELLKLQAEADSLHQQREAMLAIPGIDAAHPAVVYIDDQLVGVEKRLDDLLYNGGFFHWKTTTALGVGAVVGMATHLNRNPWVKPTWTGSVLTGLAVAVALEWVIRGRRAVLAGNFASLAKFIAAVATKYFKVVFGDGGYADRMLASVEQALRSIGKQLDTVMDNQWVAGGIGVAAFAVVALMFYKLGHKAGANAGDNSTPSTGAQGGQSASTTPAGTAGGAASADPTSTAASTVVSTAV